MQDDSDRNVYHFRGAKDETVPSMVQTVVVDQSVTELPDAFGNRLHRRVKELILKGVKVIGKDAFRKCGLQQITIYTANTQAISTRAFEMATCLENVDFVSPSPSNNEHASLSSSEGKDLTVIEEEAFVDCSSLQRIKIPSTVKMMGKHVFADCSSLVEANLSKPCMKMISPCTFESCRSLQAISLPGTLECIGHLAFRDCCSLVTVEIPAAVESLVIQERAFSNCQRLMNLTLPANYSSDETSFEGCKLLEESFGKDEAEFLEDLDDETDSTVESSLGCRIAAGLSNRFRLHPIHKLCYHSSTTTVEEFRRAVQNQHQDPAPNNKNTGDNICTMKMTPFHILCSSVEPRQDLFEILLLLKEEEDKSNNKCHPSWQQVLRQKDANDKQAMDYLITNWTPKTAALLEMTARRWMLDPSFLKNQQHPWDSTPDPRSSRRLGMERRVNAVMNVRNTKETRSFLWNKASDMFEVYTKLESISILELALWHKQIKSGGMMNVNRTKKISLDRDQCLSQCGSGVVLPTIGAFLGLELLVVAHSNPASRNDDRLWRHLQV